MLPSDSQALRVLLTSIFNGHVCGSADTDTAKTAQADILEQTRVILADILLQWNELKATLVLPTEILAMCFSFLPFRCRVTASHVSRVWRATALSSSILWAEISHSKDSRPLSTGLLKMALSRAGTVPIQLEHVAVLSPRTQSVLKSFIQRIKSLSIHSNQDIEFFDRPAPLLEYLCLTRAHIMKDFLGGQIGRLKILHAQHLVLPSKCRALSTVTELSASFSIEAPKGDLFSLFPRLQSLSIPKLSRDNAQSRFFGKAPRTLTRLELATQSAQSDIISVYKACNVDSLRDVKLAFPVRGQGLDIGLLLDDVLHLGVEATVMPDLIVLTADLGGGRMHTISIMDMIQQHQSRDRDRPWFPPMFARIATSLFRLQTLTIPLALLRALTLDAPLLPALKELRLQIVAEMRYEAYGRDPICRFCWHSLRLLPAVHVPRVVLDVAHVGTRIDKESGESCGQPLQGVDRPDGNDARDMLAELAAPSFVVAGPAAITVCGFTRNAVAHVKIRKCLQGRLVFEFDVE